jgi:hypothetical protein
MRRRISLEIEDFRAGADADFLVLGIDISFIGRG